MKTTKLIALFAVAGLCLCAQGVFAQGNDDDPPPPMSSYDESTEVTDSYNETVTIDSEASLTSSDEGSSNSGGYNDQPEKKERLRVYSGKHDGNNVIYDPR